MSTLLDSPPVVGRYYIVPCIYWPWLESAMMWWPVMGPLHEDVEFFNFEYVHLHVDTRFLSRWQRSLIRSHCSASFQTIHSYCQGRPLHGYPGDPPLDHPVMRKRRCTSLAGFEHGDKHQVKAVRAHYSGHKCGGKPGAWTCPHRGAPLASFAPDKDGVITCPLHGLRINAHTGIVTPAQGGA